MQSVGMCSTPDVSSNLFQYMQWNNYSHCFYQRTICCTPWAILIPNQSQFIIYRSHRTETISLMNVVRCNHLRHNIIWLTGKVVYMYMDYFLIILILYCRFQSWNHWSSWDFEYLLNCSIRINGSTSCGGVQGTYWNSVFPFNSQREPSGTTASLTCYRLFDLLTATCMKVTE